MNPSSNSDASATTRVEELVRVLDLRSHPEGGRFRETFRSRRMVRTSDGRERWALTSILYLLARGERSRWHRVSSDETWHWYEGSPLDLYLMNPECGSLVHHGLGPVDGDVRPCRVVPAGWWQAAQSQGAYTLVGCVVAPGFEFFDHRFLADVPALAATLRERHRTAAELL